MKPFLYRLSLAIVLLDRFGDIEERGPDVTRPAHIG